MNPHQTQEAVVVTQEDREAAADYAANHIRMIGLPERYRDGKRDDALVQAFARHRLLGHKAGRSDMREAAGKVAEAEAETSVPLMKGLGVAASVEAGRYRAAMKIAKDIRALPTEPFGGEGKP